MSSDYAVEFKSTGIIDLIGNVKITTSDSTLVTANQLYWDQTNQWIFTNQPYQIIFADGSYNDGLQFDSNQEFTTFLSRKNQGIQLVDKNKNSMRNKLYILFEYLYIIMAGFSVYVTLTSWNEDRNRAYLFLFFTVVAIFMFFLKRNFRKKIENSKNQE